MVRYSKTPVNPAKASKARGTDLRVHFKNTFEVAAAIRGMQIDAAEKYLNDVIAHKDIVPFTRFNADVGRKAQAAKHGFTKGRWPQKSCKVMLGLVQNAKANAVRANLNTDDMLLSHVQVNAARTTRRRTYRAHGRINAYVCTPSNIEIIATQKAEQVPKAAGGKSAASTRLGEGASA